MQSTERGFWHGASPVITAVAAVTIVLLAPYRPVTLPPLCHSCHHGQLPWAAFLPAGAFSLAPHFCLPPTLACPSFGSCELTLYRWALKQLSLASAVLLHFRVPGLISSLPNN